MAAKFFDRIVPGSAGKVTYCIGNAIESPIGYSVIGKANSSMLHTPEDIVAGKPREIMAAESGVIVPWVAAVSCARRAVP